MTDQQLAQGQDTLNRISDLKSALAQLSIHSLANFTQKLFRRLSRGLTKK
jgi:hypothetical protein